jgi:hypothetical protein
VLFIGSAGRARGWPKVGVRAACAASMAGTAALGVLACVASSYGAVMHVLACSRGLASCREAEGKVRGSVVSPPAFFRVSWPGPGRVRGCR